MFSEPLFLLSTVGLPTAPKFNGVITNSILSHDSWVQVGLLIHVVLTEVTRQLNGQETGVSCWPLTESSTGVVRWDLGGCPRWRKRLVRELPHRMATGF